MGLEQGVIDRLIACVGKDGLRQGEAVTLRDPGTDHDNLKSGLMVLLRSTEEVSRVVAACNEVGIAIVPQGGRTGLAGACRTRPGEVILALDRMNAIEDMDVPGRTVVVQAGCTLGRLAEACAESGLSPGIDLGARGSCTIGGLVSTNAGGMEAFRFGTMRQRVLGLEGVFADGTIVTDLSRVKKANTGYDVKQLLIGSEGTLGVVTRASLELVPAPGPTALALVACAGTSTAVTLLHRLQSIPGVRLWRAELMWRNHFEVTARDLKLDRLLELAATPLYVLYEVAAPTQHDADIALEGALSLALEEGLIADALLASSERERRDFWRVREEWSVDRVYPGGLWFDVSAPISRLSEYAEALVGRVKARDPELDIYFIGHLADGNLHVTVNSKRPIKDRYEEIAPLVYDGLEAMGGAFSAEHGIGLEKRDALAKIGPAGKLVVMRRLKMALDPKNIMNPGKVMEPFA